MGALEGTAHDHRVDKETPGVELIVRSGNRYGGSPAGSHILVDERETKSAAARHACMTPQEYEELLAEREAKRKAAENPEPPQITRIVEAGLKRLADQAAAAAAKPEPIVDSEPEAVAPDDAAPEPQLPNRKKQRR